MKPTIKIKKYIPHILLLLLCTSPLQASEKLDLLKSWMQGQFNSKEHSQRDPSYFNIHLTMKEIWKDNPDTWLYVEQAAAGYLEKPYRQRVYQLKQLSPTQFASIIYTFESPLRFAGEWKKALPLEQLSPKDLKEKAGCTVFLDWHPPSQTFKGSTKNKDCTSQLKGASYATAIVQVSEKSIVSWDRGYDANDQHVWGAKKAGYEFLKQD
ncbi:MAG: chromophore lyase CpcT/CpeT [Pseudomonadota bacterium]